LVDCSTQHRRQPHRQQLFLIAIHLLIAGNETTSNLLGGMFDPSPTIPKQYELIRANPT